MNTEAVGDPIRSASPVAFVFLLGSVLGCLPARGHTAGLDCPEMGASVSASGKIDSRA
jgi:hypothetical protein